MTENPSEESAIILDENKLEELRFHQRRLNTITEIVHENFKSVGRQKFNFD